MLSVNQYWVFKIEYDDPKDAPNAYRVGKNFLNFWMSTVSQDMFPYDENNNLVITCSDACVTKFFIEAKTLNLSHELDLPYIEQRVNWERKTGKTLTTANNKTYDVMLGTYCYDPLLGPHLSPEYVRYIVWQAGIPGVPLTQKTKTTLETLVDEQMKTNQHYVKENSLYYADSQYAYIFVNVLNSREFFDENVLNDSELEELLMLTTWEPFPYAVRRKSKVQVTRGVIGPFPCIESKLRALINDAASW